MKKHIFLCCAVLLGIPLLLGCAAEKKSEEDSTSVISVDGDELICESSVSPNEDYVESEEDKVIYTVQVYQNEENSIIVTANANSAFFDEIQYVVEYDEKIAESDVTIRWTTLMGSEEPTEEDQIALADVSILSNGDVINERKINFFDKAIEFVVDTID